MSYLLDKKVKNKKNLKIALAVAVLLILFFFRTSVWSGLSGVTQKVFRPILVAGNSLGGKLGSLGSYFVSKSYLYEQNQKLQSQVDFNNARNANYDSVIADNANIKEILSRKNTKTPMILSAILSKPNQSVYDTLIIDVGSSQGVKVGNTVFALGNVPIGRVDTVYENSSKVILFSNPGETTEGVVSGKNIFMQLVGRGGGDFEMIMPKDFAMQKGDQVTMPGINPYVLAIAQTIISDPRDPFNKALLTSPVNIQEQKFVEVEQ
ncbi:rod shape-determining protein MreC [Candidatus Nomurabacteria bacterium]|nr:rod shape-determining protein MreC [Candidatus Nomurabacteria bacterium]